MPNSREEHREYQVAPRYLANADADASAAVQPLSDAGWYLSREESGNFFAVSPDFTTRLGYLTEGDYCGLWMLTAHRDVFAPPAWEVTLELAAAPEIVTELTTALATAPRSVMHGATDGFDPAERLLANDWRLETTRWENVYRSPDGLVTLQQQIGHLGHDEETDRQLERFTFVVGPPGRCWYATACSATPAWFLETLTTAVTSPAPVQRRLRPSELAQLPAQAVTTLAVPSTREAARMKAATARTATAPRTGGSAPLDTTAPRATASPKPAPSDRTR
ncbi:DUF317 domain-containing protein [Kitasatospora phosalacinea]|uniref:DUF317 domain-containing protein n=1 Tax=Kitasatospora phosalacinea TaxID=2065 RepID=UPI003668BECD